MEDLCIESILGRLYELEKLFTLLSREQLSKLNSDINYKFVKICDYINEIYSGIKKKANSKNIIEMIDKNKNDNIKNN